MCLRPQSWEKYKILNAYVVKTPLFLELIYKWQLQVKTSAGPQKMLLSFLPLMARHNVKETRSLFELGDCCLVCKRSPLSTAGSRQWQKISIQLVVCSPLAGPKLNALEREGKYWILCTHIHQGCNILTVCSWSCNLACFPEMCQDSSGWVGLWVSCDSPFLWANRRWISHSLCSLEPFLRCIANTLQVTTWNRRGSAIFMWRRKSPWIHCCVNVVAHL